MIEEPAGRSAVSFIPAVVVPVAVNAAPPDTPEVTDSTSSCAGNVSSMSAPGASDGPRLVTMMV